MAEPREQGRVAGLGFEPRPATRPHQSARPRVTTEDCDGQGGDANSGLGRGRARTPRGGSDLKSSPPLSSCPVRHPAGPEGGSTPRTLPRPPSPPQGEALTGITRSRQMLKFFLWLDFSFLSENLVSPINSLWPNLSSSQTEILRSPKRVGGEKEHIVSSYSVPRAVMDAGNECVMCIAAL